MYYALGFGLVFMTLVGWQAWYWREKGLIQWSMSWSHVMICLGPASSCTQIIIGYKTLDFKRPISFNNGWLKRYFLCVCCQCLPCSSTRVEQMYIGSQGCHSRCSLTELIIVNVSWNGGNCQYKLHKRGKERFEKIMMEICIIEKSFERIRRKIWKSFDWNCYHLC